MNYPEILRKIADHMLTMKLRGYTDVLRMAADYIEALEAQNNTRGDV